MMAKRREMRARVAESGEWMRLYERAGGSAPRARGCETRGCRFESYPRAQPQIFQSVGCRESIRASAECFGKFFHASEPMVWNRKVLILMESRERPSQSGPLFRS